MSSRTWWLVFLLSGCPSNPVPDAGPVDAGTDPSLPGNSCESVIDLQLPEDGGELVLSGDATGLADHLSCTFGLPISPLGAGPDVIYRFTPAGPRSFSATLSGGTLHLNDSCPGVCPFYRDPMSVPFDREVIHQAVSAPVYLFAEAAGAYTLRARQQPLAPGDSCTDALVVMLDGGAGSVTGDLAAAQYSGSSSIAACEGKLLDVPDLVLAVPVTEPSRLSAQLTKDGGIGARLIWLERYCALECFAGGTQSLVTGQLFPGTHYLAVTGTSLAYEWPQPFRVDVQVTPLAPGDSCEDPLPLTFASDGGTEWASVAGDTGSATASSLGLDCGSVSPDLVWSLTLTERRNLTATVTPTGTSFRPALALRSDCASAPGACGVAPFAGAGAQVSAPSLAPGTYLLWVASTPDGGTGPFTLEVVLTP